MDVAVTEFRAHLSDWLDAVRGGAEVVITERGIPVARLTAIDSTPLLERLIAEGVVSPPTGPRPRIADLPRITASGSVSDIISEFRD